MREIDISVFPAPGAHETARHPTNVRVGSREIELDGTVASHAFQRIGGAPRHCQQKVAVRERDRVDHEKITEAALRPWHSLRSGGKNAFVVPVTVLVLDDLYQNVVRDQALHKDATVEEVAGIPSHRGLSGGDHHDASTVRDFDRIDRQAGEDRPTDLAEIQPTLHGRRDTYHRESTHPVATGFGAGDKQHAPHGAKRHQEHSDEASGQHQSAASDHRVRTPARSRRKR